MTPQDRICIKQPGRDTRFVRIILNGFGDLGLMYVQIWHPDGRRIPRRVAEHSQGVKYPDRVLHDDYCAAKMGTVKTASYFRKGVEQPKMSITLELTQDPQYKQGRSSPTT